MASDYVAFPAGSATRIAINRAYHETIRLLLIGALAAATPIIPLTPFLENYKLGKIEQLVIGRVVGSSASKKALLHKLWTR